MRKSNLGRVAVEVRDCNALLNAFRGKACNVGNVKGYTHTSRSLFTDVLIKGFKEFDSVVELVAARIDFVGNIVGVRFSPGAVPCGRFMIAGPVPGLRFIFR